MLRIFGRAFVIAAMVVAGALVVYLVAMNVFLGTRLFRNAISYEPRSLLVDYDRAYSLWPGRIHVEGLVIRGRDHNVEWTLVLDRCDFRQHFVDLLHRQFHAGPVAGDGLSFWLRQRRRGWTTGEMAATPPVPGFADPALPEPGPAPAPLTDAQYALWSVRLDDVDARHVREIWVDTMRYSGDVEIHGRWLFRPMRWLEVGPARIDMHPLDAGEGTVTSWVTGVGGHLDVTVHPFDLRAVPAAEVFHEVSIDGELTGTVHTANVVRALAPAVRFEGADAALGARIAVDHGVPGLGTEVHTKPFHARATAADFSVEATVQLSAAVDAPMHGRASIAVRGLHARLGSQSARGDAQLAVLARRSEHWIDVSGSTLVFTGTMGSDTAPEDWWAHAELQHAIIHPKNGMRLRADIRAAAKDALPIAMAVASDTPVPSWLVDAVSTKGFEATGEILATPSELEARNVKAHAQGVDARFAFLHRPPGTQWILWVDLGLLKVGVHSDDGKSDVVLLGAQSWFDEGAASLQAAGIHD
jgi:hypothetical protein